MDAKHGTGATRLWRVYKMKQGEIYYFLGVQMFCTQANASEAWFSYLNKNGETIDIYLDSVLFESAIKETERFKSK